MDPDPTPPSGPPDAPDKEKMDQIRRRRVEKLQGSTPAPGDSSTAISISVPVGSPQPSQTAQASPAKRPDTITVANSKRQEKNPFAELGIGKSTNIVPDPKDNYAAQTRSLDSDDIVRKALAAKEESQDGFENRILETMFRFTIDKSHTQDPSGNELVYLDGLQENSDIDFGNSPKLSVQFLDEALNTMVSSIPHDISLLEYLIPCWKRINKALRSLRGPLSARETILKEAKRLCFGYCVFHFEVPELFERDNPDPTADLVPYLLKDPEEDTGLDHDWFVEAVSRIDEEDSLRDLLVASMAELSNRLSEVTMNDDFRPYVHALKSFSRFPKLVVALAADERFIDSATAHSIEKASLLGPFFRLSPLQAAVTKTYFPGGKTMDEGQKRRAQDAMRLTLVAHQKDLAHVMNMFVRAGDDTRNRTLDWFGHVMNLNHLRAATRPDEERISSDGFMMNVTAVLDELCEPFMDSRFTKISRIDVDYWRRHSRVDIKEETKINTDQKKADEFYSTTVDGTSNFISEVFFLNLAAHHYGNNATFGKLKYSDKEINGVLRALAHIEAQRPRFINSPTNMRMFELEVKKYNERIERLWAYKFALEGLVRDDLMQGRALYLMRYAMAFLLRTATGSEYVPGGPPISLPLAEVQPPAFANLPEYVLEDVGKSYELAFKYSSQSITPDSADEIIALCVTFLRSSEYVHNPYIKKDFVRLLFTGVIPNQHTPRGFLRDALIGTKFANDNLLRALMKFYIEAETTGTSGQFYEKFNIRYEIFQVIKVIWTNDIYKTRLTQEAKANTQFFVQFVNLLLNDATYLLDEALAKLSKIHELEEALKTAAAMDPEEKKKKEDELAEAEQVATSYTQLSNEIIATMKLFTQTLSGAFTMPEIVQRLADMLDYNLSIITGEKANHLRVQNPQKYHFEPRKLLNDLTDVYINLAGQPDFITAVARDGRSYNPQTFENATRVLNRFALKSPEKMAEWTAIQEKFKQAKELDIQAALDLGEPPDEYMDQLLYTLMEDPVILPKSRQIVDRSTIRSHLLSNQTDPFNRQPMSIEDVIPNDELRNEIKAWKDERIAAARKAAAEKMDLTE